MEGCIPLQPEEAQVVGQCGQALNTAVYRKFGCTTILHNMNTTSWDSSTKRPKVTPENRYSIRLPNGVGVSVWKDDLTSHKVDAVVNAANEDLQHFGGLALSLAQAGGPIIQQESDKIIKRSGKVYTGNAVITTSGYLPCKKIIHAVGPQLSQYATARQIDDEYLETAIGSILKIAEKENLKSVAIPAISSGIFNFPLDRCAKVIVNKLKRYDAVSGKNKILDIRLVNWDEPTVSAMERACNQILGAPYTSYAGAVTRSHSHSSSVTLGNSSSVTLGNVTLHISKGQIQKQKTQIIVNTTSTELKLSNGAVTNAILSEAGQKLQDEIWQYRQNCKPGDVLKTKGYKLHSKYVYHVICVAKWTPGPKTAEQILWEVISECLHMAKRDSCTSIAFPAIGCGMLNFSKQEAADIMTNAVKHFSSSYKGPSMEVHFVIFPKEEDTFQAFAKKHASLHRSEPYASTSYMGKNDSTMNDKMDTSTPYIEVQANCPEANRAAKRWLSDVMSILSLKKTQHPIKNGFVMHFGLREHEELMSLQVKFQVGLQVFFTDGQAGITIKGKPAGITAAVLEVEAMCCEAQNAHAQAEEATMLYSLVRWRCKDFPDIETPEINAALEKAYLEGNENFAIGTDIRVDFRSLEVTTKHSSAKYKIERICFFKNYKVGTGLPGKLKSYFERKLNEHSRDQRVFKDGGLQVVRVETVENHALQQLFELSGKHIPGKPKRLYQRVPAQCCHLISWVGFQRDYAPPGEKLYGEGIYFSGCVKSAMRQRKELEEEEYVYIIEAEVLTGNDTYGSPGLIVPPPQSADPLMRYDSVKGGTDTVVVFNGHQALPRHIYTCKKTNEGSKV